MLLINFITDTFRPIVVKKLVYYLIVFYGKHLWTVSRLCKHLWKFANKNSLNKKTKLT